MRYVRVSDELWHAFQAATRDAGTNPSETIRQLIHDWTQQHNEGDDK